MVTHVNTAELNTNNTTMKLEEIREIKPDKEFQELFAATQPKAVFIPLVKARRPPHGVSMSFEPVLDIKPWPTEQTEEEQAAPLAEEEQATPLVFNKTFTFKIQKEDCEAFKRALDSHISCKGPRKLKKAAKHVRFDQFVCVVRRNGKDTVVGVEIFHTVNGYPYTKWVRKAIGRAYHERGIKPPKVYSSLEKYIAESIKQGTL